MTGKVFKESSNIYDDEARILFDYYKKAAEKIVGKEIEIEDKIDDAEKRKNSSAERQKKAKISIIATAAIGVLFVIGIVVASFAGRTEPGDFILHIGNIIDRIYGKVSYNDNPISFSLLYVLLFVCAFACIVNAAVQAVKKHNAKKDFENYEKNVKSLKEEKNNIRRDYKVTKMGVAYIPVATRVPFEGKSFVVDHTGAMQNTNFSLSVLRQPRELQDSLARLEANLDNIPVVEGNTDAETIDTSSYSKSVQSVTMHDYMGNIDREVRNISYLLTDSDKRSVSLPVVPPESDEDKFLKEYATADTNGKPVVKVFSTDGFESKLKDFAGISEMKKEIEKNSGNGDSGYFKSLIKKLGDSVQIVSKIKTASTTSLLDYTNSILSAVLKAGYNQYSPELEAEELERIRDTNFNYQDCVENYKPFELKESSKVRYDIYQENWVAEDGTRTIMPFGINQIEEEVLMPLINNLMNETRIERLKIYSNIKDQKLSYLNKWHQDVEAAFRDNRKTGQDLITQITNAYAEYSTAHNTYLSYKQTQEAMSTAKSSGQTVDSVGSVKEVSGETGDAIKEIEEKVESCKEIGDAFQLYMRNLQADINAASEKFGFVEYYEGTLRDGESKKVADSIVPENLQSLDERRKKIIPVNSYFATYADIPPEPSTEPSLMQDFAVDLQQVAASQIARIDGENIENNSDLLPDGRQVDPEASSAPEAQEEQAQGNVNPGQGGGESSSAAGDAQ